MATGSTADLDFSDLTGGDHDDMGAEEKMQKGPLYNEDICRVCRVGSTPGRPLFHPCVCTGSIRYIHQDCLVQWLKHSGKEFCELCMHRFEFVPIYRPDMPTRLPVSELVGGLLRGTLKNVRHWLHLGFVAFVWLVIVPICIYRIYSFLLYGSMWSIASFPMQLLSLENLFLDDVYGLLIVFVSLLGFISMVWLKDQLGNGGGPNWLARDQHEVNQLRIQEAQDQVNVLRNRLEQAGERARQRENAPERVAIATEITDLQSSLNEEMDNLKAIEQAKFGLRLDELGQKSWILTKKIDRSVALKRKHHALSTPSDVTPTLERLDSSHDADDEPLLEEGSDGPQYDSEIERFWEQELSSTNREMEALEMERDEYSTTIQRYLTLPTDDGSEQHEEQLFDCEELTEEEKMIILKIWVLKDDLADASKREQDLIERQENEDRTQRRVVRERRNRWYNRLLNRGQDDPFAVHPRRRNVPRPHRPNIVPALAGLAREQPADGANGPVADNVEELTWARLLGLDGSFRFLEHVLWLVCLNSALIIAFAYLPYQLGYFAAYLFRVWDWLGIQTWKGVVSTLFGYIISTVVISAIYYFTGMLKLPRIKSILGTVYVGIKVGIILAVEAGVFPLMCGWWIDICSFALFGSTMRSRQVSLSNAPGTVMFIHWLAGMIFIFYLASFVMLMREVVRPGVLWFLRNLNDQNFHPIHEMIGLPLQRHLRRFFMSCIMFGICVMVILLIPSRLILIFLKDFLPYRLTLSSNFSPIREVQLELVLLQFVIPTLLEHGNCRAGLKLLVNYWAEMSAKIFGLQSYLLDKHQTGGVVVDLYGNVVPDVPENPEPDGPVYTGPNQVLGPGFAPFKPYLRLPYFYLRVAGFLAFTVFIGVTFSCVLLVLPVSVGRLVMSMFGVSEAPEIYTSAIGIYILWLLIRFGATIVSYIAQGTEILIEQVKLWSLQGVKCVVAGFLLFVVVPLLLGHLVDLLLISPLRVPHDRTPVFYPSTEWALGLLHTKCTCGAIWLTNVRFKRTLDQVYQAGLKNLDLGFVVREVAWPVIVPLSLFIAVPYVVCMGILPAFNVATTSSLLAYRYFFPSILVFLLAVALFVFVAKQLKRLYTHIKNEKYLVGRQLVNYISQSTDQNAEEESEALPREETPQET